MRTIRIAEVTVKYVKKKVPSDIRILDKQGKATTPESVVEIFQDIENELQEKFITLYLNAQNHILCYAVNFVGTLNSCQVSPKEVIRIALLVGALAIITIHNHPSGDPKPSGSDKETSKKIQEALKIMDIQLLDNIIIGRDKKYYSFNNEGVLQKGGE